ncbi:response regulator [Aquibacillus halophilus]|uniref:Response regulator n=1 Tax=Aquibacillus halophilus TaxID=930132 RepID=A0A6A8DK46_9BACI|nr:response regulator [Aquibacillus halophilus]MRH43357.1 response regulator [Aquibacillus halophilus]
MARILVADDEEVLRMLITDTLEDEGHEIFEAADGQEALESIQQHSFDLIILDYMMPKYTGVEVARQLDTEWKKKNPILMLTAKTQKSDLEESRQAGIPYYMAKPFSPSQLVLLVEDILNG